MSEEHPIQISSEAYGELQELCREGVELSMDDLAQWVNEAVARFFPQADLDDIDNRVSAGFTVRTLRHYQTLGCISPPVRQGRKAIYGTHQYLQALLIRKYLYLGYSSKQVTEKLVGQGLDDCMLLLCESIRFSSSSSSESNIVATWQHITIRPGVELQIQQPQPPLSEDDVDRLLIDIRKALTHR